MEAILVRELAHEHALEQLLHLALLAGAYTLNVLQDADEGRHALLTHQMKSAIAELIDGFGVFERVLFQTTNIGVLAAHDADD